MEKNSRFWIPLKGALGIAHTYIKAASVASQVVCPFLEALLLSVAFLVPSNYRWIPILVLAVVVVFHVIFAYAVLHSQASSPAITLAEAVSTEVELREAKEEIRRRQEAYAIVRQAFLLLNNQTCAVLGNEGDDHWCDKGFENAIEPIMGTLIRQIQLALGMRGNIFSVELYLEPSQLPPYHDEGEHKLVFFGGTVEREKIPPASDDYSVARRAWGSRPYQQHIKQSPNWYYEANDAKKVKEGVYFQQMVIAPVFLACSENDQIGLIAVTSMQDEPFAADAPDMLAFYAAIVSNFVYAFCKCYDDKQRDRPPDVVINEAVEAAAPSVSETGDVQAPGV